MAREIYTVDKYSYSVPLVTKTGQLGSVSLWGENHYIAEFRFMKSGMELEPLSYRSEYDYDFVSGEVDIGQRDAIIDLLRNEEPIYLYVFHDDAPDRVIHWAWVGTASCAPEEVGEGED